MTDGIQHFLCHCTNLVNIMDLRLFFTARHDAVKNGAHRAGALQTCPGTRMGRGE